MAIASIAARVLLSSAAKAAGRGGSSALKLQGTVEIIDRDLGGIALLKQLKLLDGSSVEIGFPGGKVHVSEDGTIDMAELAIIHELGTKDGNIDSRPANRITYEKELPNIRRKVNTFVNDVYGGQSVERGLKVLGVWYEAKLKQGYMTANLKPIKQSTIDARRGSSSRPLIDTDLMRGSITSKVVLSKRRFF